MEGRRRGRRWRLISRHKKIQLVLSLTPAVNAGPRRCARPHNVSAARLLAFVRHVDVWGGVPTSCPRPNGTGIGPQREKPHGRRGHGSASGGGGDRGGKDTRRHIRDQGGRRRRGDRSAGNRRSHNTQQQAETRGEERTSKQRHRRRGKRRRGMSRDKT